MKDKYHSANVVIKQSQTQGAILLGDCNSAVDQHYLKPYKIKTILSIGKQTFAMKQKIPQDITVHQYDILDNKNQKISQLLDEIFQIIDNGRKNGGVLVHCFSGVSRSASFVLGYIMRKNFISYDDAKALVKKNRPCIYPNDGFVRQLQFYWKVLLKRNEQSKNIEKKQQQIEQVSVQIQKQQIKENPNAKAKLKKGYKGAVKGASIQKRQVRFSPTKQRKSIIELQQSQVLSKQLSPSRYISQIEESKEKNSTQPSLTKKKQVQSIYNAKTKII